MSVWQADFYRRPLQDDAGQPLWELLLCDATGEQRFNAFCPQAAIAPAWLVDQFQAAAATGADLPERVQVFRPQSLNLVQSACASLGIPVEPTRHTPALKQWLAERATLYPQMSHYTGQPYEPLALDRPPPQPLPEHLWGEQWRFATLPAVEIERFITEKPIRVLEAPQALLPLKRGLASTLPIPGVVIDGGRRSLPLTRWLEEIRPVAIAYIPGPPDGVLLEAGLVERWILTTFEDPDIAEAAKQFTVRKQQARGLHFLLVQPDNAGMTYTGFWLLQPETSSAGIFR